MSGRFVAYYRVHDGLDLREQVDCVKQHVRDEGGEIIRSYRDAEAGKNAPRRELEKALAYAKRHNATLIVATLNGLSRDVRFLKSLKDSAVDFLVCDLPHANSSTVHVLTALAEYEAKVASQRSKRAAAAYKANGGLLGAARPEGRNLNAEAREKGARSAGAVARSQADEAYQDLAPTIRQHRQEGRTLQQIADLLNAGGARTRRGRPWNAMQVSRVLKRTEPAREGPAD